MEQWSRGFVFDVADFSVQFVLIANKPKDMKGRSTKSQCPPTSLCLLQRPFPVAIC